MSATLRVVHTTGYRYDGDATSSINEARMTPRSDGNQTLLYSRLEVVPSAWSFTYTDYFGTAVTGFELHERHDELRVVSTSTVDVHRRTDSYRSVSWDALRNPQVTSTFAEFLEPSALVEPAPELADLVAGIAGRAGNPHEFVEELRGTVGERIAYLPGITNVKTTAAEVWEAGAGVCQDLSHLLIGALRAGGVPARYVSGYLVPDMSSAIDVSAVGESHAWVEYWTGSWVGLDPTNSVEVGDHHVVVGHGRDYSDVPPLRGIFTGAPAMDMFVEVAVTRLR